MTPPDPDPAALDDLVRRLTAGDRRALARAITLVESTRPDHAALAARLLQRIGPLGAGARRIGLSGTPGVGKSSFIEAFGMRLVAAGHRVAVLAVDPSSARSGGSILGDKTRMDRLSRSPAAFVRPSPARAELGGVARGTRAAIALAGAAGYDIILVETVGVGQSEIQVAAMTDLFVLLLAPSGGDELQGVKRGIMEIADLVVIHKADGALVGLAESSRADYASALRLMRRRPGDAEGFPKALTASSLTGAGLDTLWEAIVALDDWRRTTGWRDRRRADQAVAAMDRAVVHGVLARLADDPRLAALRARLAGRVAAGGLDADAAAARILAALDGAGDEGLDAPPP